MLGIYHYNVHQCGFNSPMSPCSYQDRLVISFNFVAIFQCQQQRSTLLLIDMQIEGEDQHHNHCLIVIGMAGSGKTTLVKKFLQTQKSENVCTINLDPAVMTIPYKPLVDIRDTHDYKKIMSEYQLGPNGAILTALNLFTAQPQRIITPIEQRMKESKRNTFIIDIPGQIEAFTWSASSMILTKSIAMIMPVVLLYVVDTARCQNPNSYLSNLLFAQSIECRLDYPMIICLNKVDISDGNVCLDWTKNYDAFNTALNKVDNYLSTLSKSVVLYMSDFFEKFDVVLISSATGSGFEELRISIDKKIEEYQKQAEKKTQQQIQKSTKEVEVQLQNIQLSNNRQQSKDVN